jgi:hypothetical protein
MWLLGTKRGEWQKPRVAVPPACKKQAAIAFYDSRARLAERRTELNRRLAGAVQLEQNRVAGALAALQCRQLLRLTAAIGSSTRA